MNKYNDYIVSAEALQSFADAFPSRSEAILSVAIDTLRAIENGLPIPRLPELIDLFFE